MEIQAVNPASVPKKVLASGVEIPVIGMGTFGSDRFSPDQVAEAVAGGIRCGYRLFDCAACYGNEKEIGQVFRAAFEEGIVKRSDLFIMTKVWNDMHEHVEEACHRSLEDLQCTWVDLYFIHWPFLNYHAPGCDGDARNPDAKPFSREEFLSTYRQCEALVEKGLIRHIGLSNMTVPKLRAVLPHLRIRPAACEIELHPCFQQEELFRFLLQEGIQPIGYMPMGSPARPERDMVPGDVADLSLPEIRAIGEAHGVSAAAVALKWAVQRGQIPILFSLHHYAENLRCITEDPLTEEEMNRIAALEKGNRLVKGQVFLWPGARDWHDLWDEDGSIPG